MGKRGVRVPQRIPGDPKDAHGFPALVEEPEIYGYDHQPVGAEAALVGPWSGPGRGVVGPRSDPDSEPDDEGDEGADLPRYAAGGGR